MNVHVMLVVGMVFAMAFSSTLVYSEAIDDDQFDEAQSRVHNKSTMPKTNETDQTDEPEIDEFETEELGISNWIICLMVVVVVMVLLAIITYCTHLTIEAAKVKRRGRKAIGINQFEYSDSESDEPTSLSSKMASVWHYVRDKMTSWCSWHQANQEQEEDGPIESPPDSVTVSSNAASSPTSSAVRKHKGVWKKVKGSITSLLNGSKSKQAKAVAKGKNSKVKPKEAKSKVDKSPKSGVSP